MSGADMAEVGISIEKVNGNRKQFMIFNTVEESSVKLGLCNQGISFVKPYFTAKIDTVLPLPEFYEPGATGIVKINGQTVKDHTETRRIVIIKCSVTKGTLWGINGGREDIQTGNVGITKGFDQTGDLFQLFLTGHGTDSFAYFFLTVMVKK